MNGTSDLSPLVSNAKLNAYQIIAMSGHRSLSEPPLTPIEMTFSKLKAQSSHAPDRAQSIQALFEAFGDIRNIFDPQEC
ncbi:hypothetical protein [Ralstonia pseudosolanacearum]|uniref:hypothetical protein n=1 Tax=Ralstonia pseudosolanacearum TaxID=1310165 RepID=UPI003CFBC2CE